ncbi:cytochrome c oxidase subunit 3 [Methylocystis bryophila]|uniref:Cytochrome B n=1 Tax=Methylocystis bryophila TaxID=655015 RepID=A0A1W6N0C5_9HYPH|nr:cytochrome c oxidase subunit 3 [Methylocystis bryophila]ARN83236.1 cytochrome B [Methylocystis bryophila]BDV39578.1 cytochrome c oxidase subunit III [Methylocystis bryophila]
MSGAPKPLHEPWPSAAREREGVAFGVWTFLASEILFFSALFLGYAVYRNMYPQAFHVASGETNIFYGSVNTALLLTSSFVMTLALHASERGKRHILILCLLLTAAFGLAFLAVKGLEYKDDLDKHLMPGPSFSLEPPATRLFFAFYWVMTGVHAIHLAVGVAIVIYVGVLVARDVVPPESPGVEATSLYWHLVDSIWVVLFALIYLPGRS